MICIKLRLRFALLKLDLRSRIAHYVVRVLAAIRLFLEWLQTPFTILLQIDESLKMLATNIVADFIDFSPLKRLLAALLRNCLIKCHLYFKSSLQKIRVWQHDNSIEIETLHLLSCRRHLIVSALLRCMAICRFSSSD